MPRTWIALLVFVLSGVPAAAVTCDLIVCLRPVAAAGCHEHAAQPADAALTAEPRGCTHLVAVEPYVPTVRGQVEPSPAFTTTDATYHGTAALSPRFGPPPFHGPPGLVTPPSFSPLRI